MTLTTIEYNGTHYPARETSAGLIAHIDLGYALLDEDYNAVNDEARDIDESICAYANTSDLMSLSDSQLLKLFL